MKKILILLMSVLLLISCSTEPVPLQFGSDTCDFCKMVIMDPKFGSEIVTKKGKVHRFDDINCMLLFADDNELNDESVEHWLVIDYANASQLVNARNAFYIQSETIKSPMASKTAAFKIENAASDISAQMDNPRQLDWKTVQEVVK